MLRSVRVLELAGLAPVPFAGMMLADFGAHVVRIDKPKQMFPDPLARGKKSMILDTSKPQGRALLQDLIGSKPAAGSKPAFDVLLDPYRPGVLEKLLTPSDQAPSSATSRSLHELVHPGLVVARVSGYGHNFNHPRARVAGHDINYSSMVRGQASTYLFIHDINDFQHS
jgi:alpha-methylacyl-CoA racemase